MRCADADPFYAGRAAADGRAASGMSDRGNGGVVFCPCYTEWMDAERVIAVLRALKREGVRFKVIGGVALNLLGLPRATQDLDLFVEPTADNVGRLRAAIGSVFDDPEIEQISASDLAGDYPAIQYVPPEGAFHIDILARLGQAFSFEDIETQPATIDDFTVDIATPRMLYRMKRHTVRPQDNADAARLRERFGLED